MVCLGNICRSPLAHGILSHKAKEKKINLIVDSAGTGNWHTGNKPDSRSINIAKKFGIDISNQKARQITKDDLFEYDLIYVMDTQNKRDVYKLCTNESQKLKVKLILNEVNVDSNNSVPDPYYDEIDGFEEVYKLLNEACQKIIDKI
ncbi:MAG: protein-tyrosine-phosphatase [Crocinitomicaceae bacterium]|nr:protein-tyrosine-phosphatase [Crocinitomicaceae bacterium]